jgi:ABC-type antimicrobial peptide transport system permease subunit
MARVPPLWIRGSYWLESPPGLAAAARTAVFTFVLIYLLPMLIFTCVIATIASVIPALSAARLRVAETLRYE